MNQLISVRRSVGRSLGRLVGPSAVWWVDRSVRLCLKAKVGVLVDFCRPTSEKPQNMYTYIYIYGYASVHNVYIYVYVYIHYEYTYYMNGHITGADLTFSRVAFKKRATPLPWAYLLGPPRAKV